MCSVKDTQAYPPIFYDPSQTYIWVNDWIKWIMLGHPSNDMVQIKLPFRSVNDLVNLPFNLKKDKNPYLHRLGRRIQRFYTAFNLNRESFEYFFSENSKALIKRNDTYQFHALKISPVYSPMPPLYYPFHGKTDWKIIERYLCLPVDDSYTDEWLAKFTISQVLKTKGPLTLNQIISQTQIQARLVEDIVFQGLQCYQSKAWCNLLYKCIPQVTSSDLQRHILSFLHGDNRMDILSFNQQTRMVSIRKGRTNLIFIGPSGSWQGHKCTLCCSSNNYARGYSVIPLVLFSTNIRLSELCQICKYYAEKCIQYGILKINIVRQNGKEEVYYDHPEKESYYKDFKGIGTVADVIINYYEKT